ncbi:MAG: DUF4296 domain-containing protein [Balneolaceae bacterium]|nr:DUF4296 domain-containing protein [Balneolaceae bacterium]
MRHALAAGLGLLLMAALPACSQTGTPGSTENPVPPDSLLAEETYVDLLVELQLLRSYTRTQPDSVDTDSLQRAIFRRYGVDADRFRRSHDFYQKDLEAQKQRIDRAIEELRMDQVNTRDTSQTDSVPDQGG